MNGIRVQSVGQLVPQSAWRGTRVPERTAALGAGATLAIAHVARRVPLCYRVRRSDRACRVATQAPEADSTQSGPREAWLFEMSRGEYLQTRIDPELGCTADLCDLELYVLGLQAMKDQPQFLQRLRGLSTASGAQILGVPRAVFLKNRISKELWEAESSGLDVAYLTDRQLAQLGSTRMFLADQEVKLQELLAPKQENLLGQDATRKEYVEEKLASAAKPETSKLSDLALYTLAHKKPNDLEAFLGRLDVLEDAFEVKRGNVLARLAAPAERFAAIDDVSLASLAAMSPEEQGLWLEAREASKQETEADLQEVHLLEAAGEPKEDKPDELPPLPPLPRALNGVARPMGRYERNVVAILAKEAAGEVMASLPDLKELPKPRAAVKDTVAEKSKKQEREVPLPKQKPVKKKTDAEKLVAQAKMEDLRSMVERKCKLLALSAHGNLYRTGPLMSLVLRENDKDRVPLVVPQELLGKRTAKKLLRLLLGTPEVLKVVHGCELLSDALWHQLKVRLVNVFDTSIAWELLEDEPPHSITQVLRKFDPATAAKIAAESKAPSQSDNAERTLFSLMGMDASEQSTGEEAEVRGLQLRGLLVASLVMAKELKDQSKIFQRLCVEGLEKFRSWPGQPVETLRPGDEVPMSFKGQRMICHPEGEGSKDLKKLREDVQAQKLAEEEAATAEFKLLLSLLPDPMTQAVEAHWAETGAKAMELVLHVGRPIEYRWRPMGEKMKRDFIGAKSSMEELEGAVGKIGLGNFNSQDRAGVNGTLHRISASRNSQGKVTGLTMRIGRSSRSLAELLLDILSDQKSVLLLGPPGVGKTTLLRACAAYMSEDRPTVIVDPAGEIAGFGDDLHHSVGKALKDVAYSAHNNMGRSQRRREAMTRVVENMTPKVLVVDEIGTSGESVAARTIGERGVQLVATAHGHNLSDLLANVELQDLVGGISTSVLGDDNPRVKKTGRKRMSERSKRPVFPILVELQTPFSVAIHMDVAASVDAALEGRPIPVQVRSRDADGLMTVKLSTVDRT